MNIKSTTSYLKCLMLSASLTGFALSGCQDDYIYDRETPDMLGNSIYEYMKEDGEFTYFLKLIDDLGYQETLSKTGSKTLFAAKDDAFERFFQSNRFGAHSYEELTPSQKRAIMNASMINMAYLAEMLSNVSGTDGAVEGRAIRHFTSASYLDSVAKVEDPELFANPYWSRFKSKPLYTVNDAPMIVHFTPAQMSTMGMTADDFSLIMNGTTYSNNDIYVNGIKVVERDIICKNGYIHILENVLLPEGTMADVISSSKESTIFKKLLDKFSAPYYDQSISDGVKQYYDGSNPMRPALAGVDSVFTKRYFNERTHPTGPNGESLSSYGLLYYDPSEASYSPAASEQDMGVMFVPTDKAMIEFLNGGKGSYLRDAYGSWENIPTDILAMFLKNHQKRSFVSSLPHAWSTLTDETSYPIDINPSNIERSVVTSNGIVYFINTVFPPIDYQGVYASVLTADNVKIMKWAITDDWNDLSDIMAMRYYMYLRSMENMYNLLVPTDKALENYRDPISWARGGSSREVWSFKYREADNTVIAEVYASDAQGNKGSLLRTVTNKTIIRNRLRDILDLHIIVGNNENGQLSGYIDNGTAKYFLTKGGGTIAVSGTGNNMRVNGGGDMELGKDYATIVTNESGQACRYDSDNGRTFFIDHLLHDASVSVYNTLAAHPEFSTFFDLCRGHDQVFTVLQDDPDIEEIFSTKATSSTSGIGNVVNFFNNYRYTILVPTNEALQQAFANDPKLYTWDEIAADDNLATKKAKAVYLLKFIRFHFVDNSAYISGAPYGPAQYETGARNDYDKFHKLQLQSDGHTLTITGVDNPINNQAHVVTSSGLYNIMARDFIVDNADASLATGITASSRAVIHLIDKALKFE